MIGIIDCQIGNIGSLLNIMELIGEPVRIIDNSQNFNGCDKLILPGVGAFDAAMEQLNSSGLREKLEYKVSVEHVPILGICVGAQMLCQSSEEGSLNGIGWIPSRLKRFDPSLVGHVPHMGWGTIERSRHTQILGSHERIEYERFYFTHSYYIPEDCPYASAWSYCGVRFTSAFEKENVFGVQFHPEKSHKYGIHLVKTFCEL